MKSYLDTPVVVSFVIRETHTQDLRDWMVKLGDDRPIVSDWTVTEFHSALSLKLRTGQITSAIKAEAETFFADARSMIFDVIRVQDADFSRAAALANQPDLWLRAGDALNLAIAERCSDNLVTLDVKLLNAAIAVGLKSSMPGNG